MKLAMIDINNFMEAPLSPALSPQGRKGEKLKSKMIIQVHDEVIFDVFPGEEKILQKNVKKIMENILIKYKKYFTYTIKEEDLIDLKVDFSI